MFEIQRHIHYAQYPSRVRVCQVPNVAIDATSQCYTSQIYRNQMLRPLLRTPRCTRCVKLKARDAVKATQQLDSVELDSLDMLFMVPYMAIPPERLPDVLASVRMEKGEGSALNETKMAEWQRVVG